MGLDPGPPKLLDHEAPAGGGLHGDGSMLSGEALGEALQPQAEVLPVGRLDPAAMYFAAVHLDVVEGDLLPMHVESAYNVHVVGPPQAPLLTQHGYGLMPAFELRGSTLLYFTCHLLPFVAHVSPQPVHLSLAHLVVAHQRLFDGFCVAGSLARPPEDRVLLKALRPREATDPDPLGQERQSFEDVLWRRVLAVEERAARGAEGGRTTLASVTLAALLALTELDDVGLIHLGIEL